ncbi:MAG: FG-GAP repeat domain-containing protein [Limisphaerales bacterium]
MNFIGLAEVTGDQHWDILWSYRYYLIVWEMQGTNFVREHIVSGPDRMSSSARIKVLADFTGDNLPDLIWQDASGRLLLTSVHRLRYPNSILLDGAKPANLQWNLCGVGDFNFDGKPDLLWHHQDGRLATWFMNGATKIATSPLRNAQPVGHGWKILDTQLRIVMPNVFIQNPPIRIIPIPPIPPLPLPPYPNGSILNDSTIRTGGSVIVVVTPRRVMASPILRYPR